MITSTDVIQKVRDVAAADPDHVYQGEGRGLVYTSTKTARGCLIGEAMSQLGFIQASLDYDGVAHNLMRHLGIHLYPWEASWLDTVQLEQDCRATWSKAVEAADERYPL